MKNNNMKPTKEIAVKVLQTVDAGLCNGVGSPVPGQMCIEAAVCFALGMPHGDEPPCVGDAVRSFKIALNDCNWSSNEARAKGMRRLAIAQLGSDSIDQKKFAELLAMKTINRLLPKTFRMVAELQKEPHNTAMLKAADACAAAARAGAAAACAGAAAYATYACAGAGADAAACAGAAAARACADACADAFADAPAAPRAAAAAAPRAAAALAAEFLILMAEIGLECLVELNSPGCVWLSLCN